MSLQSMNSRGAAAAIIERATRSPAKLSGVFSARGL
jgi:hypothetical protein